MALKTSVKAIARRIAQAVESFATEQGLPRGDYALVGTYDERTERISLTLGADRPIDERRWYSGIVKAIRQAFPEYPQMTMHVGLVVENAANLDDVYAHHVVGEGETDLTDLLDRH